MGTHLELEQQPSVVMRGFIGSISLNSKVSSSIAFILFAACCKRRTILQIATCSYPLTIVIPSTDNLVSGVFVEAREVGLLYGLRRTVLAGMLPILGWA
jgi:hypothetical protein